MSVDQELRARAIGAFSTVLKNTHNCETFEKNIYEKVPADIKTYTWIVYQVIGFLSKNVSEMKSILQEVKNDKIGWKSSIYENIANKLAEYDEYLVNPFEVVEGVVECGKCHSKKTWSVQRQTRSSDEPMTTFSRCVECGHQWSYSG
jgi:DNA-directed RNA polymerase subunit M/transcription elongation factor TFIIS